MVLARLRPILDDQHLDGLLVTGEVNVQYLSGFTGDDTYLLITHKQALLITDFRYLEQAQDEARGFRIIRHKKGLPDKMAELVKRLRIKRLGFESHVITHAMFRDIAKKLPSFTRLKPTRGLIEELRAVKSPAEIQRIREAITCARESFFEIKPLIKPGVSEETLAAELEHQMRKRGAVRPSFPTIVAADSRASLPHARATAKKLKEPGLVQFDWGATLNQYQSDTSRVIFLGKPSRFWQRIYAIVYEAQQRAFDKIKPGVTTSELDAAARGFITEKGYGPNFGHGLGHGVGRGVHEQPGIRRTPAQPSTRLRDKPALLQPGMVFTVEPGIYLPGKGGIRIEDMVLVTPHGYEILTSSLSREIDQMVV